MTKSSNDKYTDPELRDKIKEEIQEGDKGGEPGQWSARKAQLMAKEYKAQGGGYKTDKKDDPAAQHLDKWTEEEWQTKDGDGSARSEEGTHRYLPKKAWEKMSESEKEATDEQKLEGSKAGDQYVENTDKAKRARKEVSDEDEDSAAESDEGEEEDNDKKKPPAKKAKTKAGKSKATKDNEKDDDADANATKQKSSAKDVKKAEPKKSEPKKSEKAKGKNRAVEEEESDDDDEAVVDDEEDGAGDATDDEDDLEDEITGDDDDEFVPEE